jgi:hypothetical protein
MNHNLDSRLEKLEARCLAPERPMLVRILAEGEDYAEKHAEAERQAKQQGKGLFVIQLVAHRKAVSREQPQTVVTSDVLT